MGILNFLKNLFKKKKPGKIVEPIIPDHQKKKIKIEQREFEIQTAQKEHHADKLAREISNSLNEKPFIETPNSIIPRKGKEKKVIDLSQKNNFVSLFKVNGVYSISDTLMLTGFVETGKLKKGMKAKHNENQLKIIEVRDKIGAKDVLNAGEEGTLTIKTKKTPIIYAGDFLEFD